MWHKNITRQQFVEAVGCIDRYQRLPFEPEPGIPSNPVGDKLMAVWLNEELDCTLLPHVLLVSENRLNEFFSFNATFVSSLKPLTAHVRLMTHDSFTALRLRSTEPPACTETFVGAVIAETLSEVRSKSAFESLSINSFTSTYSFSMARCLHLYESERLFDETSNQWFGVRDWTRQSSRRLQQSQLLEVWDVLRRFSLRRKHENLITDALLELSENNSLSANILGSLTESRMHLDDIQNLMSSPRDERLTFVENFLRRESGASDLLDDFLCGFFMSLISNGTMDYAGLLIEHLEQFPTGLMWYGICSGVRKEGRLDSWKRGLQHWITREIQRPFDLIEPPRADISALEFQVLLRSTAKGAGLQENSRTLVIELSPGVHQSLPWPPRVEETKPIVDPHSENMRKTVEDVHTISQKCQSILKRLDAQELAAPATQIFIPLDSLNLSEKKDRNKKKGKR